MTSTPALHFVRNYSRSVREVWRAWTTPESVSAWWGPRGFATTVETLEPWSGGRFHYVMEAVAPDVVHFCDSNGIPRANVVQGRFDDVTVEERFTIVQTVDFVPSIPVYELSTTVTFRPIGTDLGRCRTRLSLARMHNDEWTERSVDGWRGQLRRLARHVGRQ